MKLVTRLGAVGVAVFALTACNQGPNPTDEVTKALKQANLNEVSVDWDGGARVAHLRGRVERPTDRQRAEEVVDTSTFAGAPLACATALATLDTLAREKLVERSARLGTAWREAVRAAVGGVRGVAVRGAGLMLGVDLGAHEGAAVRVVRALLERGFLATTGGGKREVLVLTPPLTVAEAQLEAATAAVADAVREAA